MRREVTRSFILKKIIIIIRPSFNIFIVNLFYLSTSMVLELFLVSCFLKTQKNKNNNKKKKREILN